MKIVVLTPHFEPDTAPTGAVITKIVRELVRRGHEIEVITSLPWYRSHRIEDGYEGRLVRREDTPWGSVVRLHPFPANDKTDFVRRALGFAGFSALAAAVGARGGRADVVLAVSPPLTLGVDGWLIARARKARFVFNIQDVYPDVAIELGVLRGERAIAAARRLERFCYDRADAVTVLSDDLQRNVAGKTEDPDKVVVIPNFVDTQDIRPLERENDYRREFGLTGKRVVMYAGNVGMSQSLDLMLGAARELRDRDDLCFVINGDGAQRRVLEEAARDLPNVRFVDPQPYERLPEVLAAADLHVVALKRGLASASVPSKTYSILAAGRPLIASVDAGSAVARIVDEERVGLSVEPESPGDFTAAVRKLLEDPAEMAAMGERARSCVEAWASPEAIARAYEELFGRLLEDQTPAGM